MQSDHIHVLVIIAPLSGTCVPVFVAMKHWKLRCAWITVELSLIPRPLLGFISQPWSKIRRRPGIIALSWTGNGAHG